MLPRSPPCPAAPCALHVLVALDVTDYQQSNLHPYLERILRDLAALDRLTCRPLGLRIGLQSVGQGGDTIFRGGDTLFQEGDTLFQERLQQPWAEVLRRLARAHAFQRSYFNQPALQSFLGTLARQKEDAKVGSEQLLGRTGRGGTHGVGALPGVLRAPDPLLAQMLLVLTDGLDDDVQKMKEVATAAWLQGGAERGRRGPGDTTQRGVPPLSTLSLSRPGRPAADRGREQRHEAGGPAAGRVRAAHGERAAARRGHARGRRARGAGAGEDG